MPRRFWRKLAILHKRETSYGTAPTPAPAAADAIVAKNINFTPLQAEQVRRDLLLPYMGNQGAILAAEHGQIEFEVEMAGAGAAGTVPKYGSLLRVCGMSETVLAATSVTYAIVESAVDSGTLYFNSDGVQWIFLGGRATVRAVLNARGIPVWRFRLLGLLGTVTDAALPTVSMTGWTTPVKVSNGNTTLTVHGWAAVAESVEFDLGNTLTPRFWIGDEAILITDRQSTARIKVEARHVADIDWHGKVRSRARGAISLIHGTAAGNIVEISAPAAELDPISIGQTDGIVDNDLPFALCPVSGLDEMTIVIR